MEPYQYVALIGGATVAAVLLLVFLTALAWDPHSGFRREKRKNAFAGKAEHRFDTWLFVWTMLYVLGSAAWLRAITDGDQFGRGITYPMWMPDRPERFFATSFFHPLSDDPGELRPSVEGFAISVDAASCNYTTAKEKEADPEGVEFCGARNPQVPVHANVTSVAGVRQGLILTVHASSDFETWVQASTARLPRDLITRAPSPIDELDGEMSISMPPPPPSVTTSACFGTPGYYCACPGLRC